ncbi:MAG TPA: phosphoribosylaminoimidazolesuccinocarboxamide synthase [Candidatus Deferrimicrobium sp.]|nr:phosphoribosylaminoimidazolesuccinocarboxamide synthase [Candidatus Deferrimicrobium sp.]
MPCKLEQLYEGKAKKVFKTEDPELYWVEYKDDATAFNGEKKGTILDKGYFNNQISALFFKELEKAGVPTHMVELPADREMIVKSLQIIPLEVVVRNIAAGSLAKRLGFEEGRKLPFPVVEFYYKDDELGDPLVNESHIAILAVAEPQDLEVLKELGLKVNKTLQSILLKARIELVDFKLEFGWHKGQIILGDEISPDTCRFWDAETGDKLDKDRFRRDLGKVEEAYAEVFRRLQEVLN